MAIIQLVMDKGCSSDEFFPICHFCNDTGKTPSFITCHKMAIFELAMDKCCSSDEFLTYLPISAMMLERPLISSVAVSGNIRTSHG